MAGINDALAVLRGGAREGETTTVSDGITRIVAPSDAPGLVDIYELTDEVQDVDGSGEATVYRFVAQEPAPTKITAESMHFTARP